MPLCRFAPPIYNAKLSVIYPAKLPGQFSRCFGILKDMQGELSRFSTEDAKFYGVSLKQWDTRLLSLAWKIALRNRWDSEDAQSIFVVFAVARRESWGPSQLPNEPTTNSEKTTKRFGLALPEIIQFEAKCARYSTSSKQRTMALK